MARDSAAAGARSRSVRLAAPPTASTPSTPVRELRLASAPIVPATDLGSVQTLKHSTVFLLSDQFGDIHPDSRGLGLYQDDTRILSRLELRLNGRRPALLQTEAMGSHRGTIHLANPDESRTPGPDGEPTVAETRTSIRRRARADRRRGHPRADPDRELRRARRDHRARPGRRERRRRHLRGARLPAGRPRGAAPGAGRGRPLDVPVHRPRRADADDLAGDPRGLRRVDDARRRSAAPVLALAAWTRGRPRARMDGLVDADRAARRTQRGPGAERLGRGRRRGTSGLGERHDPGRDGSRGVQPGHRAKPRGPAPARERRPRPRRALHRRGHPLVRDAVRPRRDHRLTRAPRVPAAGRGRDARGPRGAPGDRARRLARRGAGQDPPRVALDRDGPRWRSPVRAVLRQRRRDTSLADPALRDVPLDRRPCPGRCALAERARSPGLDRRGRRRRS